MKRKHPLRRILLGTAATVASVVALLALKQPGPVAERRRSPARRRRPPARPPPGTGPGAGADGHR